MTVNGFGLFIFGDTVGIFVVLKLFSRCKAPVCISVLVVLSGVCCTAPHRSTVVVVCVTDDILLRICVCACARAVFLLSCKSCYL
jgi:hypothetical protein